MDLTLTLTLGIRFEAIFGRLSGNREIIYPIDVYIYIYIYMVKIIINSSTAQKAEEMAKLISELLYRINPSILWDLKNFRRGGYFKRT